MSIGSIFRDIGNMIQGTVVTSGKKSRRMNMNMNYGSRRRVRGRGRGRSRGRRRYRGGKIEKMAGLII